ncbi:HAD family hydrolase [Parvibaculum sp.]|uniref:HAD family hydrolase n=1 Tax=Parvibaculum sp. TaxID=2024848 RepID=UPI00320DC059
MPGSDMPYPVKGPQRGSEIRAVLFDKDGTLFSYHETWGPILREAAAMAAEGDEGLVPRLLEAVGYNAATGRIGAGTVFAAGETVELATLWNKLGVKREVRRLVEDLDSLFAREAPRRSHPVTDLQVLFSTLRQRGLRLGLATNDGEASAFATIARFGLAEHLEFHCGYDSGYGAKPLPGMVNAFCAAVGVGPEAVAVVGDNSHDLDMGRAAGAGLLVGVLTGTSARGDLAPLADAVIDSIADLPMLLDERG